MNRTLKRQISRIGDGCPAQRFDALLEIVSATYDQYDNDRRHGDRANALMADELTEMVEIRERAIQLESEKRIAEEANRAKSQFLATMSHELRTPLNAILGYTEILREEAEEAGRDTDVQDHDRITSAGKRLLALINEVLDLSKIEAGKMEVDIREFDVAELVSDVTATTAASIEARGNTLHVVIAPGIPTACSDQFRLGQCLLNLLANAAKFTHNGDIHLLVDSEDVGGAKRLLFKVEDTGIGISPEQLKKLFEPFTQADQSITRSFGGTGLGLTITRRIANILGGDVSLESKPGEGTIVTLRVLLTMSGAKGLADGFSAATESEASGLAVVAG